MQMGIRMGVGAGLAVVMLAAPVVAQDSRDDVKRQIEGLKQGQQEILKQPATRDLPPRSATHQHNRG
jgi:hypothetical protein